MRKLLFAILSILSVSAFAQNPTTVYWLRSRVTDTTTVIKTSGYGALYFDVGRNKWRYYVGTTGYDFGAGGGGGATYTAGNGMTLSSDVFKWGGALTENTTLSGSGFNVTYGSSGTRLGNYRVWSNGTIGLDGSTTSFLQTGSNTISTTTSGVSIATSGPISLNTSSGTSGQVLTSAGSGASPVWSDKANTTYPSVDKTASFVAATADAGVNHYNITPASATTITFPDLTGLEGLQWAFWKNVDADAVVFDFDGETANGATILPDTSWVYVNWSDGRFKVAGTNPAAAGGGDVSSVFSRTGAVVAASGDYTAAQVTNTPAGNIAAVTAQTAINELDTEKQPIDSDLTAIAGLSASNDDFLQRKSGAWANRTVAQVKTDLGLTGTNSGDQTITLTGDVTGSGTGSFATTLAASGASAGSYTKTTVNTKGLVTAGTNQETQTFDTKTANYTLVLTDCEKKTIIMNVATANTLTVPTNTSVAFPTGSIINVMRTGAGATTVTPADGTVTITSSSGSMVDPGSNIEWTLKKLGTNLWSLQNGLPSSTATSGTYTPTLTNTANLAASTAYQLVYYRVGNAVTVAGRVDVDPTTTVTSTQLSITLPIASNFTTANQAGGTASATAISSQSAAIISDATADGVVMQWIAVDVTNQPMYFSFTYQVL